MSTERSSSQRLPMLNWTRKAAREMQSRKPMKEMMREVLEARMVEEEEIKGSHSPISDVFILVLLLWLTALN